MGRLSNILQKIKLRKKKLRKGLVNIIKGLKQRGALKIILFGSMAKGKIFPDSDLDLLVIMPDTKSGKEWLREIYSGIERKVACDFLVYNLAEFKKMRDKSSILREALKNGRPIYEKRR